MSEGRQEELLAALFFIAAMIAFESSYVVAGWFFAGKGSLNMSRALLIAWQNNHKETPK